MKKQFPEVFIGSSSEGEAVARAIELHLHRHANVTIWMNGVFTPGVSYLQSLLNALDRFDFAVLILTPDDLLEKRDDSYSSPRDNVVFELGLFMGRLGVRRAFFVAEDVAAGIALASHICKDPAIASHDAVVQAIESGLDDSRSRVRYRFVELIDQVPELIVRFHSTLQVLLREESNEVVRRSVESTLSRSQIQ